MRINKLLILSFILIFFTKNVVASDYIVKIDSKYQNQISVIDFDNDNKNEKGLKNVCKIAFTNMYTSGYYQEPLRGLEILTNNGTYDFGALQSYSVNGNFENGRVISNYSEYAHYYVALVIKDTVVSAYPSTQGWRPSSKNNISLTIELNNPSTVTALSYSDFPYSSAGTLAGYNIHFYDCDNGLLFGQTITERISSSAGEFSTFNLPD